MSKGVNCATVLGYVGRAPEIRATRSGETVASFSVATSEKRKKGDGWEEATEWHSVVSFGKLAEIVREFVRKGSHLYITGKLRTVSWEDDHQIKRYRTSIQASEIILLDTKDATAASEPPPDVYEAAF